jgi:diaminohydroxyphosphoribosylaminopyrimidine deaminase/5-amino-6-(5-phosphoribosylamino)uracil reductase
VTLKAAMTLDGKIAPPPTDALDRREGVPAGGWITSEVARAHVQELRHQNDALLVGAGTILSDNPLLTDRSGRARRRPLLRVILDSRLRMPVESRLVRSVACERKNDVLVFCAAAEEQKKAQLEELGIRVEAIPVVEPDGRPDLPAILRRLGELEITSVMIEGGATVNWTALAANAVDKVFLYYAPKILAGAGSIPFAAGAGFHHMSQAAQVKRVHLHQFGEDFAVEGYLRDPYGE